MKMKHAKRIASFLLALVLALSMTITAFATEDDGEGSQGPLKARATVKYTINIDNSVSGHIYEAYQIFTGDLATDTDGSKILSNIVWGNGITEDGQTALQDYVNELNNGELSKVNAKEVAKYIATLTDSDDALGFADTVSEYLSDTCYQSVYSNQSYTISVPAYGYYLIKDSAEVSVDNHADTNTRYILEVVGSTTELKPKNGTTTSEKHVLEGQDCPTLENADRAWQDVADYDIGDKVNFELIATIAEDYENYETYYLAFHDTQSTGLTFSNSVNVFISNDDGTTYTPLVNDDYYTLLTGDDVTDGCTFEVVFTDLTKVESVTAGTKIRVTYYSELNEDAVIGGTGNENEMHVEYSKDSNNNQSGNTGSTPDDKVVVFTYELEIDKVDEGENPLVGAGFTLYKLSQIGTTEYENAIYVDSDGVVITDSTKYPTSPEISGESLTTFIWKGLDAGDYILRETTVPSGYNKMEDIRFSIVANKIDTDNDEIPDKLDSVTGTGTQDGEEVTFSTLLSKENNSVLGVTKDIVNEKGVVLPETGGTGVKVLYTVGSILVIAAAVLLITRRRMKIMD
jgi:fimbrial isopeptide formation D2 family protein/LPXTG-motif cell wall-anchored protein